MSDVFTLVLSPEEFETLMEAIGGYCAFSKSFAPIHAVHRKMIIQLAIEKHHLARNKSKGSEGQVDETT